MDERTTFAALLAASALGAGALAAAVIVNEWMAPSTALMFGAGGYVLFVGGWIAGLFADDADSMSPNRRVRIVLAAAAGLVLPAVAGLWNVGSVRASATAGVAGGPFSSPRRVLRDDARAVRLALCRQVLGSAPAQIPVVERRLRGSPAAAAKCVRSAEGAPRAARRQLARGLLAYWRGRLVGKPSDSGGTCRELRAALTVLSQLDETPGELLFRCSVGGTSDRVETCCREELKSRGTEVAFDLTGRSPDELLAVLGDLVPVVFPTARDGEGTDAETVPAVFQSRKTSLRKSSVAAACQLVDRDRHAAVGEMFYDFAASQSCKPEEGRGWLTAFSAESVWERACDPLYGFSRDEEGRKPAPALCHSLHRSVVRRAVEEAKSRLSFSVARVDKTKNRMADRIASTERGAGRGTRVSGGGTNALGRTMITSFDTGGQNFLGKNNVPDNWGGQKDERKCTYTKYERTASPHQGARIEKRVVKPCNEIEHDTPEGDSAAELQRFVDNIERGDYFQVSAEPEMRKRFGSNFSESREQKAYEKLQKTLNRLKSKEGE